MFLRWPAALLFAVLVSLVLFKMFSALLNSRLLTKTINRVANPRAESAEELRDDFDEVRQLRDQRLHENEDAINRAVEENQDLRSL